MNNILKVTQYNEKFLVNAQALYNALDIKDMNYDNWLAEYVFSDKFRKQDRDWFFRTSGYELTIEYANELASVVRNENTNKVKQFFEDFKEDVQSLESLKSKFKTVSLEPTPVERVVANNMSIRNADALIGIIIGRISNMTISENEKDAEVKIALFRAIINGLKTFRKKQSSSEDREQITEIMETVQKRYDSTMSTSRAGLVRSVNKLTGEKKELFDKITVLEKQLTAAKSNNKTIADFDDKELISEVIKRKLVNKTIETRTKCSQYFLDDIRESSEIIGKLAKVLNKSAKEVCKLILVEGNFNSGYEEHLSKKSFEDFFYIIYNNDLVGDFNSIAYRLYINEITKVKESK